MGYDDFKTEGGPRHAPSIETIYGAGDGPGLFAIPAFLRTEARAAIDWRTSPGYSRKGGFYGVTLANYADRNDTYSFRRLDGELIQHLPILRENWVISLRGRVQTILDDDDAVPYFLLPQLGSGRTLRGYETGRFRDRHSLLTSAEFRWIPNRLALDMALFYDAGKVTSAPSDLDFNGLKSDWGIGARFHGPTTTVLRIEAAHADRTDGGSCSRRVRRSDDGAPAWFDRRCTQASAFAASLRGVRGLPRARAGCYAAPSGRSSTPTIRCTREPETQDASKVQEWEIGLTPDLLQNLFGTPGDPTTERARRTSTRSTRCPTRAGSPTGSTPGR